MSKETVTILGVDFINTTHEKMVKTLHDHVQKNEKTFVVTANPEIVLHANEDKTYKNYLNIADYITADGIGIVKAAKLMGKPLPERVTGFDMFMSLLNVANENHYSIYLLGAREEVLEAAKEKIKVQFPNANIVGSHHGFFQWEDAAIPNEIKKLQPDFIFVALGFPRQEKWIAEHIQLFNKGIFMGIGGSFDVLAGTVKRAPVVWQKLNIEWLYRLLQQPTRWRRMLALPNFAMKVLLNKGKDRHE